MRNADSDFFWTGFRRLLGAFDEICPGSSDKLEVCDGGARGSGRGVHPTLVQVDLFFVECLLRFWAPAC